MTLPQEKLMEFNALVSHIESGNSVAVASDFNGHFSGAAMEVSRELIRRGVRNLRIIAVPSTGLQADLLIGAGVVSEIECGALIHGAGAPPNFVRAFKSGAVKVTESTCPAIFHGLTAAEKGLPYIPVRGILGSDLVSLRKDWRVVSSPFDPQEQVVVVPPIVPDIALFHAPMADRHGNIWIGRRRELALMAHASRRTLATVERIWEGDLMEDKDLAVGTLSTVYVDAVARCEKGAWPFSFGDDYPEDAAHIGEYLRMSKTVEGFRQYVEQHVLGQVTV